MKAARGSLRSSSQSSGCAAVSVLPSWRSRTVLGLAQAVYEERRFDLLPVLGDALEDAGATDGDLLGHLRGPGPHARGCWAIDLLLGKGRL
jgi:hypothetical protein